MTGSKICANHQISGLSSVGLHAFHEISEILAGAEVAVAHDYGFSQLSEAKQRTTRYAGAY